MNQAEAGMLGYKKTGAQLALYRVQRTDVAAAKWRAEAKRCPTCQTLIPYEKRRSTHCNHSCAAIARNGKRLPRLQFCAACAKPLRRGGRKFCSGKCQHDKQYQDYIERWLAGEETGCKGGGMFVSSHIHRWIRETRGEKCEVCGWCERNPVSGNVMVQLEHVDGNSQNNRPENLKLLCPNHHALTPTFGGLNRGNGRARRRKKQ